MEKDSKTKEKENRDKDNDNNNKDRKFVCSCPPGYFGDRCERSECDNYCLQVNSQFHRCARFALLPIKNTKGFNIFFY